MRPAGPHATTSLCAWPISPTVPSQRLVGQGIYTRHLTKALVDLGHTIEVFSGQPYPVLDERIGLTKLPSLDLFNDHYPGRFPAYWELKSLPDLLEVAQFSTGHVSRTVGLQLSGLPRAQDAGRRV